MKKILEYLKKAEGSTVHRNPSESDITAPYGIYKHIHPRASIFEFLDRVALECEIPHGSKHWDARDLNAINQKIEEEDYGYEIEKLAEEFYQKYLLDAHIEKFPTQCRLAMFSMFTHSTKNSVVAVQRALRSFIKSKHIDYVFLEDDGGFGKITKSGLDLVRIMSEENPFVGFCFEATMVFEMTRIYSKLVAKNPKKYLQYSEGWDNRMDVLLDMR